VPLALGLRAVWLRAVWQAWRGGPAGSPDGEELAAGPSVLAVAGVTIANGGDNVGVYVPVFAVVGTTGVVVYAVVFLVLVGVWCAVG
jgi:cadmium resistance protein CadD (predicted permease)